MCILNRMMASLTTKPKIALRSIDYLKFKNLIIDRNPDDLDRCNRDILNFCEAVRRLYLRDQNFEVDSDRERLDDICGYYKLILEQRKIIPVDIRIRSGWWGCEKNAFAAGKLKASALKEVLVRKANDWGSMHGFGSCIKKPERDLMGKIDGPGIYIFKHRDKKCFQFVGRTENIFASCSDCLKASFEGSTSEPLAALFITSLSSSWDFYFIPVEVQDVETILRVLENDTVLKHDSIWPYGLNARLNIGSYLEVSQLRLSCIRHCWPPDRDAIQVQGQIYLNQLRQQIHEACSLFVAFDRKSTDEMTSQTGNGVVDDFTQFVNVMSADDVRNSTKRRKNSSSSNSSAGSTVTATTVKTAIDKKKMIPATNGTSEKAQSLPEVARPEANKNSSCEKAASCFESKTTNKLRSSSQLPPSARKTMSTSASAARSRSVSQNRPRSQRTKSTSSSVNGGDTERFPVK